MFLLNWRGNKSVRENYLPKVTLIEIQGLKMIIIGSCNLNYPAAIGTTSGKICSQMNARCSWQLMTFQLCE